MEDFDDLSCALRLLLGTDARFSLINSRLILRTGVNLRAIAPEQAANPDVRRKVVEALQDMGFDLAQ